VALGKAGHPIDKKTWFRNEFFRGVDWKVQQMRSGNSKEAATVEFDVHIDEEELGSFPLRVDHAEVRIADQDNVPTYLNWSSLIDVIRKNDFRDWWLELARLTDGGFRLRLLQAEPAAD
jgi:hypothetical protein